MQQITGQKVVMLSVLSLILGMGAAPTWAQEEEEGRIIQIAPDPDTEEQNAPAPNARRVRVPRGVPAPDVSPYWLGIIGGPVSPPLRHHLEVPEGEGLMVMEIVSESPAAEGGLEQYDILLRGNGEPLRAMSDLVKMVAEAGEEQGQITLEVMRGTTTQTVWVTPENRPPRQAGAPAMRRWVPDQREMPRELENLLGAFGRDLPRGRPAGEGFEFRNFGPGVIVGGRQMMQTSRLPNGVSIQVKKQDDQPTQIVVEKGDERWEVTGDDPESLDQLPDDVRPFVEQMLRGTEGPQMQFGNDLGRQLRQMMPPAFPPGPAQDDLRTRLQEMERQMEELRSQFLDPNEQLQGEEER